MDADVKKMKKLVIIWLSTQRCFEIVQQFKELLLKIGTKKDTVYQGRGQWNYNTHTTNMYTQSEKAY